MDTSKDYYRVLEVHPQASAEMIERAKRLLLQRYHPDKNPTRSDWASERTRAVLEAFKVVSVAETRQAYDAARRAQRSRGASRGAAAGSGSASGPRRSAGGPREAGARRTGGARTGSPDRSRRVVPKAVPGYRVVICGTCGRPSHVRQHIPLYKVTCGGCGSALRHRLTGRVVMRLRRIDEGLERLRSSVISVLAAVGIRSRRR